MIIGLTGGIASGKSAVSHYIRQQGIPVVDADQVSRQVVQPGEEGLRRIVEAFGQDILINGELNRSALRTLIFSDEEKRLLLNSILHPLIHETIIEEIKAYQAANSKYILFDAPLLLENHLEEMVDVLWVVACDEALQIQRVMKRDQVSKDQALTIIKRQMPLKEKIKLADVVLYNNGTLQALYEQIDRQLEVTDK